MVAVYKKVQHVLQDKIENIENCFDPILLDYITSSLYQDMKNVD